ncbi:PREDICTED: rabenosyn-5 [Nicrophorus vespilloides]|uniref:Rabenosyn-5 n=1 Tax=Nicrophorus vespilloides TaxID=110193 RepID=A0ABM1NGG5_NICVS|nr:PREDICTED: rabenosyn-5 [Nicrophorus vespilloides]
MAEFSEGKIMEGFLCPMCHTDMRSSRTLLAHFQEQHSEEQDILKSLKELVGKAKSKILKLDDKDLETFNKELSLQKYFLEKSVPQDAGQTRSHIEYFKEVRRERLDHRTSETNKLIIRLDRFLRAEGTDRKQIAQSLVTWLDGSTVSRCPSCASSFNITRRQHHCRLCGSIMCNSCSCFLTYDEARNIISPMYFDGKSQVQRTDEETLRICVHCANMLDCRRSLQMSQNMQLPICKYYEKLQQIKYEIEPSLDLFNKMYKSIMSGDVTYQLQDAQSLKTAIAKQAELLDAYGKKIASLPPEPNIPKAINLHNAIRRGTAVFIKEHLLSLPVLPSPAELEHIKQEQSLRNEVPNTYNIPMKRVAVTTGWSPAAVDAAPETSEDPLIEQMNIVRNYIEQAKKENRFDEVVSLRENLDMLKKMYRKKVGANHE